MKKRTLMLALAAFFSILLTASGAFAHCEIPCGIYDDQMRIQMLLEHADTIEKSMKEIGRAEHAKNYNQMVRWVTNKEDHADRFQEVVSQYFMTQRIKFDTKNYANKLALLHRMLVYAMKCKQTTDTGNVKMLRTLVGDFRELYFTK